MPTSIAGRSFDLGADVAAAMADATAALSDLGGLRPRLASAEGLARAAMRAEGVASSRMEGVRVSPERLARAAHTATRSGDPRAREVLGNVEALAKAQEIGTRRLGVTVADIEEIHRTLFRGTEDEDVAGLIRTEEDWIGVDDYNPVGADYVPPPPETLRGLLEDLCGFIERRDLDPTAQAAIAHAQFKNIHPFAIGNGRMARALIYTVLRRHVAGASFIPPISPLLAARPKAYVGGLGAFSVGHVEVWCQTFAEAILDSASEAGRIADALDGLCARWLEQLDSPRSDSAARQILVALSGHPVIDAGLAESLTGKSHTAVHKALNQLERAGILQPLSENRWGRAWQAGEVLELVAGFGQGRGQAG